MKGRKKELWKEEDIVAVIQSVLYTNWEKKCAKGISSNSRAKRKRVKRF